MTIDQKARWFDLTGDARLGACATDDCGGQPTKRLEAEGVGSNYCSGCAAKIAALPAPDHAGLVERLHDVAEDWRKLSDPENEATTLEAATALSTGVVVKGLEWEGTAQANIDRAEAAEQQVRDMREGPEFYRDGFKFTTNPRYGGLEWKPTEALLDDCGNIARLLLKEGGE